MLEAEVHQVAAHQRGQLLMLEVEDLQEEDQEDHPAAHLEEAVQALPQD